MSMLSDVLVALSIANICNSATPVISTGKISGAASREFMTHDREGRRNAEGQCPRRRAECQQRAEHQRLLEFGIRQNLAVPTERKPARGKRDEPRRLDRDRHGYEQRRQDEKHRRRCDDRQEPSDRAAHVIAHEGALASRRLSIRFDNALTLSTIATSTVATVAPNGQS